MDLKEQLIQKLFNNQSTKEELNLLFDLIQKDDSKTAPDVMMALLPQMENVPKLDTMIKDRIFEKVLTQTAVVDTKAKNRVISIKSSKRFYWIGKIAAAVLFLVVAGWFISQQLNSSEQITETGFDERKEIVLPDGSHVTLNGNSTLQYFSDWSAGETRVVKLQGEAYFQVDKKEETNTKFQVLTKDLTVEVLGTVFNVNTRQEATKVFLEKGKVKLNLEDKKSTQLLLEPGQVVTYSAKRKSLLSPHKVANELQISWKDGYLTFKDSPLKEILEQLAATSNLEFEIETAELAATKFRLTIPNNDIPTAMTLLSKTLSKSTDAEIHKMEERYIFKAKAK